MRWRSRRGGPRVRSHVERSQWAGTSVTEYHIGPAAPGEDSASSATPQPRLAGGVQQGASARGAGAAHACLDISAQSSAIHSEAYRMEIPSRLGNATGAKQWRSQMARKKKILGRGLCRDASWLSGAQTRSSHGLFWSSAVGSDARHGRRRAPAYGLRPPTSARIEGEGVNHVYT